MHEARFVRFDTGKAYLGVASHALLVFVETFGFACWHRPPIATVTGEIRFHTKEVATTNQSLPIRRQTSPGGDQSAEGKYRIANWVVPFPARAIIASFPLRPRPVGKSTERRRDPSQSLAHLRSWHSFSSRITRGSDQRSADTLETLRVFVRLPAFGAGRPGCR
jgi:hypothetical protein